METLELQFFLCLQGLGQNDACMYVLKGQCMLLERLDIYRGRYLLNMLLHLNKVRIENGHGAKTRRMGTICFFAPGELHFRPNFDWRMVIVPQCYFLWMKLGWRSMQVIF